MLCLIASMTAAADEDAARPAAYQPGRGWTVPDTDLTLGGYASAGVSKLEDQPWSLDLSHLSLFLWWQSQSRLKFFSESELEDFFHVQEHRTSTDHAHLDIERLYLDWEQADELKFRVGKFLTPIGRWNLVHAQPLVWTTSRPLTTEEAFPTNATGAMVFGTLPEIGSGLDYSAYGSYIRELRQDPDEDAFTKAYGLRLSYPLGPLKQIGFSFANFEQKNEPGERKNLVGLDFGWARNGYEVSAEGIYRFSNMTSAADEKGGFVQGVLPLAERWYGVARYEYFHESGDGNYASQWLAGVDYRWSRAVLLKAEYSGSFANHIQAPGGFLASVAVLF
jgi:hypothetical protein